MHIIKFRKSLYRIRFFNILCNALLSLECFWVKSVLCWWSFVVFHCLILLLLNFNTLNAIAKAKRVSKLGKGRTLKFVHVEVMVSLWCNQFPYTFLNNRFHHSWCYVHVCMLHSIEAKIPYFFETIPKILYSCKLFVYVFMYIN